MSVQELYQHAIKPLSPRERLKLATLILNDIPPQAVVDDSDEWSEEDHRDFNQASWNHIQALEDAEHG
jgi:hypothetical protein